MTATVVAVMAGLAVARLLVRRPLPRRDPSGTAVGDVLGPATGVRRGRPSGRRPMRSPEGPEYRAGGRPADLVTCIDLLCVAATSGQTVPDAVRSVGAVGSGPLALELDAVAGAVDRGASLSERLEDLADRTGPEVRSLVGTLQVALRSGDGAAPALQRLADAERRRERRRRETRLRRLPVLLTIPLVLFVLPAFVVLTLVPVALSAADGLPGLAADPHLPLAHLTTRSAQ